MEDIKRNWTEDLTHENGNYLCICTVCKEQFQGHKRRVVCKLCATHPSDPDIEEQAKKNGTVYTGFGKGCSIDMSRIDGFRTGAKWMRDRMNGEMCAFLEWAEENDYQRGGLPEKLWFKWEELKVIDIPYTTEQLLQKFRNRDL